MNRYRFIIEKFETPTSTESIKIETIYYKCLICGFSHDWSDEWDDVKKAEVKAEVDQHHQDHIVDQSLVS